MKKIFILAFFVSQMMYSQGGEKVFYFLDVRTSARQAALGGKALTILDDANQPLWNPATINKDLDNQLAVNYLNFLAGVNYGSFSYSKFINEKVGTFNMGVTYANFGTLIEADEQGNETGTFTAYDMAISLGYAYKLAESPFTVGANVKFINSVIHDYSSSGIAVDLGLIYQAKESPFEATLVFRNMGTQITEYDEVREEIPFEIALGASYRLENVPLKWYLTLDNLQQWQVAYANPSNTTQDFEGNTSEEEISAVENAFRHVVLGVELFPESGFNIRLGYNYRRAKELQVKDLRTFAGVSAGFGLRVKKLKFSYAFTKYHPAENTSTFSLQINLN